MSILNLIKINCALLVVLALGLAFVSNKQEDKICVSMRTHLYEQRMAILSAVMGTCNSGGCMMQMIELQRVLKEQDVIKLKAQGCAQ